MSTTFRVILNTDDFTVHITTWHPDLESAKRQYLILADDLIEAQRQELEAEGLPPAATPTPNTTA